MKKQIIIRTVAIVAVMTVLALGSPVSAKQCCPTSKQCSEQAYNNDVASLNVSTTESLLQWLFGGWWTRDTWTGSSGGPDPELLEGGHCGFGAPLPPDQKGNNITDL